MKSLPTAGKAAPPSLSPQCAGTGPAAAYLVGPALNNTVTDPDQQRSVAGEASLTVNTQVPLITQNGTRPQCCRPDAGLYRTSRNSGLITGDNGLMLNAAPLSNPGKSIADTLSVRATTLDGDGLLQGAGALALAGDTLLTG